MKIRNIILTALLIGCGTSNTEVHEPTKTDSLLIISDSVAASAARSSDILDSVTTVTAEKVTDNVKVLTNTINNYETKIKSAVKIKTVEKVIRDTVYIETKKSFWGKTKKSITTSSDSSINQLEAVDTTQQ